MEHLPQEIHNKKTKILTFNCGVNWFIYLFFVILLGKKELFATFLAKETTQLGLIMIIIIKNIL